MRLALLAALVLSPAAAADAPDDALDPVLVGTWTSTIKNEHGEWTFTFKLEATGAYRTTIKGPAQLPDDAGKFSASKGVWSVVKVTGLTDQGTYTLVDADTLSCTGQNGGTIVWKRVGKPAAPAAPQPAAPTPAPAEDSAPSPLSRGASGGKILPDLLGEPVALPKGRLEFMTGLEQFAAAQFDRAAESFGRAVAADEENSEFVGLQGAALVLGEKFKEGMAALDRALRLNPRNITASRMMRFAYALQNDAITAAKFYGHGSLQDIDILIGEVAGEYAHPNRSAPRAKKPEEAGKPNPALQRFPLVASTVAAGYRTRDKSSVQAEYALGVGAFQSKDYARALVFFRHVLDALPYDWSAMVYYARCCLETGDAESGRSYFTYALSYLPAQPDAYAGRALCAARQGDATRAKRDLALLAELDPGRAKALDPEIQAALGRAATASNADPKALWESLRAAAESSELEPLVEKALELRRAMNARRLRYDEIYQEGLRERSYALRRAPQSPDGLVDVADYLHGHRDVPGLQVSGPNGPVHRFRFLSTDLKDWEATFARKLCAQALQIDPKHWRAMVRQAAILFNYTSLPDYSKMSHPYGGTPDTEAFPVSNFGFDRLREIEKLCLQATNLHPKTAEGWDLLSDVYREYAAWQRWEAYVLRNPVIWTRVVDATTREFIRWDWKYGSPSPEAVAKAEALEKQAAENDKRKTTSWAAMAAAAKGTDRESYYAALDASLRGDAAAARAFMDRGIQARPQDPFLRKALADTLRNLKLEAEYIEEYDRYIALIETSAEVRLKVVWEKIQRNAWKTAEAALERAAERDPADARVAAFRGVFAETQERWPEAAAWYRVALALEEARARLNGTTFLDKPQPGPDFRSPDDFGLTWAVRLKAARLVFFKEPATAAALYMLTVANEARLTEWQFSHAARTAMLPDPRQDAQIAPEGPMTATILLETRRLAGQALVRSGKSAEGLQQLAAAEGYEKRLPGGGTAYLTTGIGAQYMPYAGESAWMWARFASTQALLDQGNVTGARAQLDLVRRSILGHASVANDPAETEYNRLASKVGLPLSKSGTDTAKADPGKVDPKIVGSWKGYVLNPGEKIGGKGSWLTYQFYPGGDYTLTIHPVPGTQSTLVNGKFEAAGGKLKFTNSAGKTDEIGYEVDGTRWLNLGFPGGKVQFDRQ